MRKYLAANRAKVNARKRAAYRADDSYSKAYYRRNRKKIIANAKAYYRANADRVNAKRRERARSKRR